jgi:tetratricopeptide (TPR) repeat protein
MRCAAEVQRGMLDREPGLPDARRIRFRIGINLGDEIADDDIYGDGVNIAARLEALAEPGGICDSSTVHDHIRDKLPYRFADQGEQSVKNIARPVRVYALRPEDRSASRERTATPRHPVTGIAIGLAAVAALVIAAGALWLWPATKSSPPQAVAAATTITQPLAAPRKARYCAGRGRCEEAILELETAFELNHNWLNSLDQLFVQGDAGSIEEAIPRKERAIRLSPHDPLIGNFYSRIGLVHLLQSRLDEAILWHERARSANPASYFPHAYLAAEYALKGELARASVELAEAQRLVRDARLSSIARVRAAGTIGGPGYWGVPKVAVLFEATYFAGLRKAGMPEE